MLQSNRSYLEGGLEGQRTCQKTSGWISWVITQSETDSVWKWSPSEAESTTKLCFGLWCICEPSYYWLCFQLMGNRGYPSTVRWQNLNSSGALQTCAFLHIRLPQVDGSPGRSFPCWNDEDVPWNFWWGSVRWQTFSFCSYPRTKSVPSKPVSFYKWQVSCLKKAPNAAVWSFLIADAT